MPHSTLPLVVSKVAEADFPTEFAHFRIYGFEGKGGVGREEAIALVLGSVTDPEPMLLRVHSQCLTGDVFHSLRCDCRAQLELALEAIANAKRGMVIYEKKEGRGIGLLNKLRAYELQDAGADTVEANEQLGFEADLRHYQMPGEILKYFGVKQVRLMTNNPDKMSALEAFGIQVVERVPCQVQRDTHNSRYLKTKKKRFGHLLDI
jgi:GTP cyclohydrolase II